MSVPETVARRFFFTGGTLPPDEPSYIERAADRELWESIQQGDLCYVLSCRQIGKSSLVARAAKRLRELGDRAAYVDLTNVGTEVGRAAADRWYYGVAHAVHRALRSNDWLPSWWAERERLPAVQRLVEFFSELVLPGERGKVVVFFDEVDSTIRLPFSGDFFAALRACYNARATEPDFRRLVFVLIGVATPAQLISDPVRTPFNVGKGIELRDFSLQEAAVLARGIPVASARAETLLDQILGWTSGQPYLTQVLCKAVAQRERDGRALPDEAAEVDQVVNDTLLAPAALAGETHLRRIAKRLTDGSKVRPLLKLYRRIRQAERVPDDEGASPLKTELKLAGIVRRGDAGVLEVRNRIYESIFSEEWIAAVMPPAVGVKTYAFAAASVLAIALALSLPLRDAARQLDLAVRDWPVANSAYKTLHRVPFLSSYADEHLARFFDRRALRLAALDGKEDETLLFFLKALSLGDTPERRRQVQELLGSRYYRARLATLRVGPTLAAAYTRDGTLVAVTWQAIIGVGPKGRWAQVLSDSRSREDSAKGHPKYTAAAFYGDRGEVLLGDSQGSVWRLRERSRSAPDLARRSPLVPPLPVWPGPALPVEVPLAHCSGEVRELSVSRDGSIGVTRCAYRSRVWNERAGTAFEVSLSSAAVRPDGGEVAIVRMGHPISILSTADSRKIATLREPPGGVLRGGTRVAFSMDGNVLMVKGLFTISRYDTRKYQPAMPTIVTFPDDVRAATINRDGTALLRSGIDGDGDFWDDAAATWTNRYLHADDGTIGIAFTPDGDRVISSNSDGVRLWELPRRGARELPPEVTINNPLLIGGDLSDSGRFYLAVILNDELRVWSTGSGELVGRPIPVREASTERYFSLPPCVRLDNTGTLAFVSSPKPMLWRLGSHSGVAIAVEKQVFAAAFTADGRTLITGDREGLVQFWNTATALPSDRPISTGEDGLVQLGSSPDGRTIVGLSAGEPAHVVLLRAGAGLIKLTWPFGKVYLGGNATILFTNDLRSVLVEAGRGVMIATTTGSVLGQSEMPRHINSARYKTVAFDPATGNVVFVNGQWLVVAKLQGREVIPIAAKWIDGHLETLRVTHEGGRPQLVTVFRGATDGEVRFQRLDLNPRAAPDSGADPADLLEAWEARLDLGFDQNMEPTAEAASSLGLQQPVRQDLRRVSPRAPAH